MASDESVSGAGLSSRRSPCSNLKNPLWQSVPDIHATHCQLSDWQPGTSPLQTNYSSWSGLVEKRSHFSPGFGSLFTPGTPYLTHETVVPEKRENKSTFALLYNSEGAASLDGSTRGLPRAHGFSGSLVWDTKAMRCFNEQREWGPELAEVTGIVWGWPTSAVCLLATKIEYVREFMLTSMHCDAKQHTSRGKREGVRAADDWNRLARGCGRDSSHTLSESLGG